MDVFRITRQLAADLAPLTFSPPVTHVYNPLQYAWESHRRYLERYGQGRKTALLVGMNPGPWGMAQTGIPFGDTVWVRDWLGLDGEVEQPARPHPKRPVEGFACRRREISGSRLWGWARARFETPDRFFQHFFVLNFCPLCLFSREGRNITPDQLPTRDRDPLEAACGRALRRFVEYYRPDYVIGVGGFAEKQIRNVAGGPGIIIGKIPHPSPANPQANRGWSEAAEKQLADLGILERIQHDPRGR
ncbi:MAG: uracil-DNA glycosylase family protein [bacterium]